MADIGSINSKEQKLIAKSKHKSDNHPFATVWVLECQKCENVYGANSCDNHIRNCPSCSGKAKAGHSLEGISY